MHERTDKIKVTRELLLEKIQAAKSSVPNGPIKLMSLFPSEIYQYDSDQRLDLRGLDLSELGAGFQETMDFLALLSKLPNPTLVDKIMEFIRRVPLAYLDFSNVNFNKGKLVHSVVMLEDLDNSEFEFVDGRECIFILYSYKSEKRFSFRGANLESSKVLLNGVHHYPENLNFAGANLKKCWLTENVLDTALLAADLSGAMIASLSIREGTCKPLRPEKCHYTPQRLAMANNADQIENLTAEGRAVLQTLHQRFMKEDLVLSAYVSSRQNFFHAFCNYGTACVKEKSGWKFHINISKDNYQDLFSGDGKLAEQLFTIFQKYEISGFKYRQENDMDCKQITAYVYRDPWSGKYDLPIEKYLELIKEVEQFLSENNIKPSTMQPCDAGITGSLYFSLRNDKNSKGDYIPAESAKTYNPSGSTNPFYAYINVRRGFDLTSQTEEQDQDFTKQTQQDLKKL